MPELTIKIGDNGPDPFIRDGDISQGYNARRIKCVHAQHVCHPKLAGFNRDGLRASGIVMHDWFRHTHQYILERISLTEARRTNLITLEEEVFSGTPNARGEYLHVQNCVDHLTKHSRHLIFGTTGREFWFGGLKDFSTAKLDLVWNDIETKSALREVDHRKFPFSDNMLSVFLCVAVDDFTDVEARDFTEHEYRFDGIDSDGERIDTVTRSRMQFVSWRDHVKDISETDVRNKSKVTDARNITRSRAIIVEVKT